MEATHCSVACSVACYWARASHVVSMHALQVTVHLKGETECFECTPKPVPKSFPICTLRNTPDKPIHCIVWAKDLLFGRMFGKAELTGKAMRQGVELHVMSLNTLLIKPSSAYVLPRTAVTRLGSGQGGKMHSTSQMLAFSL